MPPPNAGMWVWCEGLREAIEGRLEVQDGTPPDGSQNPTALAIAARMYGRST